MGKCKEKCDRGMLGEMLVKPEVFWIDVVCSLVHCGVGLPGLTLLDFRRAGVMN